MPMQESNPLNLLVLISINNQLQYVVILLELKKSLFQSIYFLTINTTRKLMLRSMIRFKASSIKINKLQLLQLILRLNLELFLNIYTVMMKLNCMYSFLSKALLKSASIALVPLLLSMQLHYQPIVLHPITLKTVNNLLLIH